MAVKAGAAMATATHAMLDVDPVAAQVVIAGDDALDDLTGRIECACYDAVARQQPVARDLRLVVSAMQISTSLERMGDLADHVAKRSLMRHPRPSVPRGRAPNVRRDGGRGRRDGRPHRVAVEESGHRGGLGRS